MPKKSAGDWNVSVRRSKAGLGLFAEEEIPKGSCIIEYFGRTLAPGEEAKSRSKYLFEISTKKTIDGQTRANTARYINHSCRPNCEPEIKRGKVFIYSKRRIKPGEELAYDYGKAYFDQMLKGKCRCVKCMPPAEARKRA